jgi:hypothetical protein
MASRWYARNSEDIFMTTSEQLASVNSAISAIESGAQEYRIGTRLVRRGELRTLYMERERLERKLAAESGFGVTVAEFDTR